MEDKIGFGNRIKTLRELRGFTIEQAAECCGASVSIWRQYEKGERLPSIDKLIKICLGLRQKPEYFFGPELDALMEDSSATERVKSKIDQLPPDDIEVIDAAISKRLELKRN